MRGKDPAAYRAWKEEYWRTFLTKIELAATLETSAQWDLRVLDAGCGPAGIFTVYHSASVTAVDPLLDSYDELPGFARTRHPNVHWVRQGLEDYVAVEPFDLVFCLNVINHVRDLRGVLQVLAEALRPGGTMILSVDAHRHTLLKPIFSVLPGDVLHPHQMNLTEYLAACGSVGLTCTSRVLYKREAIFDYWVLTLKHTFPAER